MGGGFLPDLSQGWPQSATQCFDVLRVVGQVINQSAL